MSYLKSKKGSLESSILGIWNEAAKKQQEKLDPVNKAALAKDFQGRKDKDIDNDGDVDSTDKYLHKRRKAVSKAIAKEGKMSDMLITIDDIANAMKKNKTMKPFIAKFKTDAKKTLNPKKSLEKVLPDYIAGKDIAKVLENYEVGTKERRDHTIKTTPGQSVEDFEKQVDVMHKKKNSMREAIAKLWGVDEGHNPFDMKKDKKFNGKDMKKEKKTMTGKPETKVEVEPKIDEKKK